MKQYGIFLLVYLIINAISFGQDVKRRFDLGIYYTPPGLIGSEWRKPVVYVPYTIHTNSLDGSYELGFNFNYHFSKRWVLSAKISNYNAHMFQRSTHDVAIFDPEIEWIYANNYEVRCHVFNFKPIINLVVAEKDKFSVQLLTGPVVRIPAFRKYQVTSETSWNNIIVGGTISDRIPFHLRMGLCGGISFTYNLHKRLSMDLALNFEWTRSILDKTHIWYPDLELDNHWQKAIYFPITFNYKF